MGLKMINKNLLLKSIIIFILLITNLTVFADTRTPIKILKITDGDSLEVQINRNKFKIRLIGIDCYETCKIHRAYRQAYENNISVDEVVACGKKSKEYLQQMYKDNQDKEILFDFKGVDKYGRALGILYFDNVNINQKLLENGGCKKYEL